MARNVLMAPLLGFIAAARRRDGHILAVAVVMLIVGAGFVWLAAAVQTPAVREFDWRVIRSFRRDLPAAAAEAAALAEEADPASPVGPDWLAAVARGVTHLGNLVTLSLVVLAGFAWLFAAGRRGAAWLLLAAGVGGWGLERLLKILIARPRPPEVLHLVAVGTHSFPSGHAMLSVVVYLTLAVLLAGFVRRRTARACLLTAAALMAILIGLSRVYLGVHYPTDVLGGWTAGLVWVLLCWLVARCFVPRTGSGPSGDETGQGDVS